MAADLQEAVSRCTVSEVRSWRFSPAMFDDTGYRPMNIMKWHYTIIFCNFITLWPYIYIYTHTFTNLVDIPYVPSWVLTAACFRRIPTPCMGPWDDQHLRMVSVGIRLSLLLKHIIIVKHYIVFIIMMIIYCYYYHHYHYYYHHNSYYPYRYHDYCYNHSYYHHRVLTQSSRSGAPLEMPMAGLEPNQRWAASALDPPGFQWVSGDQSWWYPLVMSK